MNSIIRFFCKRHVLVNLITVLVFMGGVVAWMITSKEELPDITFNTVRVSTLYSGASAADIEFYVTQPLEELLQGIDGVYKLTSTSSSGRSSISIELDRSVKDIDKIVTEIQSQVSRVSLPDDILDDPSVRVFETSKKAIIDIALYDEDKNTLDIESRIKLQRVARGLESKLLAIPEVFSVNRSGYLTSEVLININPKKLAVYDLALSDIGQVIQQNHVRAPSGTLKSGRNEQVTVLSELDTKKKLDNVVIQGGFDSKPVKLGAIATITDSFEEQVSIYKVNGREAVLFNVVKTSKYGIIEALEKVRAVTDLYQKTVLKNSSIKVAFLDDESIDVRNRLDIVSSNGMLGFFLIVLTLFVFLNKRSGFWVALGIPFTLCFTLIGGYLLGYSINGVTLAGLIIVLGIVVDDAIIVAENISRKINEGMSVTDAAVEGTVEVIPPILASVATTCVAFIPLFFFSGRFGSFVMFIPPIIFLMLVASLFESFFLLPPHMTLFSKKSKGPQEKMWFKTWEDVYERCLQYVLPKRYWVLLLFCFLMIGAGALVKADFKFVMFPDEESREIVVSGIATDAVTALETSNTIQPLEEFLRGYLGQEGIAIRSAVARGRRGAAAVENQFNITLEITPADTRDKGTNTLLQEIKTFTETLGSLSRLRFRKNRFGQSSGSVFEIVVQENDDKKRDLLLKTVMKALAEHPDMTNLEEDVIPTKKEYILHYNQEELKRLSVNPSNISSSVRSILSGKRLYTVYRDDEDVAVTLTVEDAYRKDMLGVLSVPIANNQKYLIPLKDLVTVGKIDAKNSIRRQNLKRSSFIYADIQKGSKRSPLDIADEFEQVVFPMILADFPSSQIHFEGEVMDTRDSQRDFLVSILAVILLIYVVLAILFDSLIKPLRIMLVIPFGIIGVVLAFYMHGKTLFGFYAAIGTLGMLGVVINDAIVMMSKLDKTKQDGTDMVLFTAGVAKTRLRAIILTTFTTVLGVMPTAYGFGGTDVMLGDMMIAMGWGLLFGTAVTLILTPCFYLFEKDIKRFVFSLYKPGLSLLIFCFGLTIFSSVVEAKERELSLKEFVALASKNDPKFHRILMDELSLRYDTDMNVESEELVATILTELTMDASDKYAASGLSLERRVPLRGQSYESSYAYDADDNDSHTFSFSFSQDIAQNAFGKAVKLDSQIQDIKTDVARYQITEAYEDYMAELMSVYYTWTRQYESYRLAQSSYKENEKVLASIVSRQKKKVADQTDVNKLKLLIIAKEEQVIIFEKNYKETMNKMQRVTKLGLSETVIPDSSIILDSLPSEFEKELSGIKDSSRSFRMLALIQSHVNVETARLARELMPSIELSAAVLQNVDTSAQLSATIALPFQKKKAKAAYAISQINQEKNTLNTESTSEILETAIQNLHLSLVTQKKLVTTAAKKRGLAAKILENESENYAYGKISLNDYIAAVNRFDSTRFDEIDQKITFQQLSVEWKRLTDQLI